MDTVFFVYLLTFANGKAYVGMSKTDAKGGATTRYRDHARTARYGKASPIYNAWRKHGAPVQSILSAHATRDECALAEIDAIQAHDSMNPARGYNLQPGGQGLHASPGTAIYELMRAKVWDNPERRRKSSEALKGKPLPDSVLEARREWVKTPEAKALFSEIAKRPERNAKLSVSLKARMTPELRKQIGDRQRGRGDVRTPEGRARNATKRKAWLATPEGKAATQAGMRAMRSNPENETKRKAAAAEYSNSAANLAQCQAMGAKARKAVKDLATGQVYESRQSAARAFGVTGPTVGYWVEKGKFAYIEGV